MADKPKYWQGAAPEHCDICKSKIRDRFIDGATRFGPWANMCPSCHMLHGRGLGTGLGQKYVRQGTERDPSSGETIIRWMKVAG